jgi:hypothetical protein
MHFQKSPKSVWVYHFLNLGFQDLAVRVEMFLLTGGRPGRKFLLTRGCPGRILVLTGGRLGRTSFFKGGSFGTIFFVNGGPSGSIFFVNGRPSRSNFFVNGAPPGSNFFSKSRPSNLLRNRAHACTRIQQFTRDETRVQFLDQKILNSLCVVIVL